MGEAGSDHHTVDELFQILCVRNIPPVQSRRRILEACQNEKLKIDFHIRPATDEELRAYPTYPLLKVIPPEGITGHVHPESWERVFTLTIKEGRLVVKPITSLDYPPVLYSFTITNWSVINEINELWSPLVMTFVPPTAPIESATPIANAPTAPVAPPAAPAAEAPPAAPAAEESTSETAPLPKMSRPKWVEAYLTKERKKALENEYRGVVEAAKGVLKDMKNDPRVDPYRNARILEPYLAGIFPKRRPRRNPPGRSNTSRRFNSQRS